MHLKDFFDLKLLEQLLKDWSKATGLATIAVDNQGKYISSEIGFTDFCMKYTRGSAEGSKRCLKCDNECTGTYFCHAGLMDFSVDIINLVKYLKSCHESIICNQVGRSGTSIGANIHEAQYAQSRKDFISKLEIALKESNETSYWLKLLLRTNRIDEKTHYHAEKLCGNIRRLLIASVRTAKENQK